VPCDEHISQVYAQLGRPGVDFPSFWDVYNQLRDAVDSDFLFESTKEYFASDEDDAAEDPASDADQLPLRHLRPCELSTNRDPVGQTIPNEGEADCFFPSVLTYLISSPDLSEPGNESESGMATSESSSVHR